MTDRRLSLLPPWETGTRKQRSWQFIELIGSVVRVHYLVGVTDVDEAKAKAAELLGREPRWEPFGAYGFSAV